MGTKNITRVMMDGELKVCQYGHYDGYPTAYVMDICEFLKKHSVEEIRERFADVSLEVVPGDIRNVSITGTRITNRIDEVAKTYDECYRDAFFQVYNPCEEWHYDCDSIAAEQVIATCGYKDYFAMRAAARNTGVAILSDIMRGSDPVTLGTLKEYQDCSQNVVTLEGPLSLYTLEEYRDRFGNSRIRGVYELDLDDEQLVLHWRDVNFRFDFDWLKSQPTSVVKSAMEAIEDYGWRTLDRWGDGASVPEWFDEKVALVADIALLLFLDEPFRIKDEAIDWGTKCVTFNEVLDGGLDYFFGEGVCKGAITELIDAMTAEAEENMPNEDNPNIKWFITKALSVKEQLEGLLAKEMSEPQVEER